MNANAHVVAQIFNLLYRRLAVCTVVNRTKRAGNASPRQIENLRYSRLKICATPPRANAFTLIELLVVLALLCLLAATLLPAMAKSRPNSLAFQCQNNIRQLSAAWRMYADDSRDRIVYSADDGGGISNPQNQYAWTWSHLDYNGNNAANWDTNVDIVLRPLWPYTGGDASIYRCPADRSHFIDSSGAARQRVRSFSMNTYLGGFAGTCGGPPGACSYRLFLKTTDLTMPGPAKTSVFIEERREVINWGNFFIDMDGYYPSNATLYKFCIDLPACTHDLACSFSFADGHTEMHRWRYPQTTPIVSPGQVSTYPVPRDQDVAWLQDHATRPR